MPDDFNTLSSRLLSRCPAIGINLSRQLINDSWRTLQSRRTWSFRRGHGTFAPPNLYQTGKVTTNVGIGLATTITGIGTAWTPDMVGRQIRIGGLLFPYYTIVSWISATSIMVDLPWAGPDQVAQTYQIIQCYYPVPDDFNYFYALISVKDGYRLWTNITESDLALLDPQRTNTGQTYASAFYGYSANYGGSIGPALPTGGTGAAPISTTTLGYRGVANNTYIVQVVAGGITGTASWKWMRAGQTSFSATQFTTDYAVDMMDGVQVYWPDSQTYVAGDIFVINALSQVGSGTPLYELWPSPTYNGYLYPYIYIKKETDLTPQAPQLPPFIANRGEVILEMALAACASFPGPDTATVNPYFNLKLLAMHQARADSMIWDLERNDEEVGVTNIEYQNYPFAPAPWLDGHWQQQHSPFLAGY